MCTDCQAAKETDGHWRLYDTLKCKYCSARLIQMLGRLSVPQGYSLDQWRAQVSKRRRQVLDDSAAAGLDPEEIRKLVKGRMAVAP